MEPIAEYRASAKWKLIIRLRNSADGWSRFTASNALRTRRQLTFALFNFVRKIMTLRFRFAELGEFVCTERGSNGTIAAHPRIPDSSSQLRALSADANASEPS